MMETVREMTFEEEALLYEKEARAEFAKENGNSDSEGVNNILRRGMRIIRKARELIGKKPMTNGDEIRAMTDEELAWELMMWRFDAFGKAEGNQSTLPDSQKAILEYLKQPVEAKEIVENCVSCQINLD